MPTKFNGVRRIGVISDTHGLLRPEAVTALAGVDLIIHAGDIGAAEVLEQLRSIAPLVAIRGNNDTEKWARDIPETEAVEVNDSLIYVLHNIRDLDIDVEAAGFHLVIAGHSHQPSIERRGSVMFLNPGSAGPRRFTLPIALALLHMNTEPFGAEIVELVR
ncbi:MAG: metallophosphoesterase family protein [Gammaproteobacteria bacterium]|nr:metallophosphoesterase family protein [Gammaproteobacteria bacterium]